MKSVLSIFAAEATLADHFSARQSGQSVFRFLSKRHALPVEINISLPVNRHPVRTSSQNKVLLVSGAAKYRSARLRRADVRTKSFLPSGVP